MSNINSRIKMQLEMETAQYQSALANAKAKTQAFSESVKQTADAQRDASSKFGTLVDKTVSKIDAQTLATLRLRDAKGRFVSSAQQAIKANTDYAESIAEVSGSAQSTTGSLGTLIGIASQLAVAFGGTRIFYSAISSAAAFSKELANVKSIADGMNMDLLKTEIEKIDAALGTSSELTNALYFAYSSGIKGSEKEMVKFTADIAQLNAAIGGELTPTMDAVTTVMNAYGLTTRDSGRIADWFFQIIKSGKAEGPALATSLGQVMSTAAMAKVPLDELGAAMATLSLTMPTEQAIVALNMGINGIIDQTSGAGKILKDAGVEISAADLASNGLVATLEKVQQASGGNIEVLTQLFGSVRAVKAMAALTSTQFDQFTAILQEFKSNTGVAATAAATQLESMDAKISKIQNNMAKQMQSLGHLFEPIIKGLADMDTNTQNAIISATGAATAITLVALAIKGVTVAIHVLDLAVKKSGWGAAISLALAGVSIAVGAISAYVESTEEALERLSTAANKAGEISQKTTTESDLAIKKMERLQQLNSLNVKSQAQVNEQAKLIEQLEGKYGSLGLEFDHLTGNIINLADSLEKVQKQLADDMLKKLEAERTALQEKRDAESNAAVEKWIGDSANAEKFEALKEQVRGRGLLTRSADIDRDARKLLLNYENEDGTRVFDGSDIDKQIAVIEERMEALRAGDKTALTTHFETANERSERERKAFVETQAREAEEMKKLDAELVKMEKNLTEAQMSETDKRIRKINEESDAMVAAFKKKRAMLGDSKEGIALDEKVNTVENLRAARIQKELDAQTKDERAKKEREEKKAAREAEIKQKLFNNELHKRNKEMTDYESKKTYARTQKSEEDALNADLKKMSIPDGIKKVNAMIAGAAKSALDAKQTYQKLLRLYAEDGEFTDVEKNELDAARENYKREETRQGTLQDRLSSLIEKSKNKKIETDLSAGFSAQLVGRNMDISTPIMETAFYIKQQVKLQEKNNELIQNIGTTF